MSGILIGREEKQTQKADNNMKTEAEIGVMQPPTKKHLAKGKEGSSAEGLKGPWPCQYFYFGLLASRVMRQ